MMLQGRSKLVFFGYTVNRSTLLTFELRLISSRQQAD